MSYKRTLRTVFFITVAVFAIYVGAGIASGEDAAILLILSPFGKIIVSAILIYYFYTISQDFFKQDNQFYASLEGHLSQKSISWFRRIISGGITISLFVIVYYGLHVLFIYWTA